MTTHNPALSHQLKLINDIVEASPASAEAPLMAPGNPNLEQFVNLLLNAYYESDDRGTFVHALALRLFIECRRRAACWRQLRSHV